jgi:metal-responsive CopG/Arc/MetJ family transcriptional regulator
MDIGTAIRVSVTLPRKTLEGLKRRVTGRTMSRFVAEAIEEKLERERKEEAWRQFMELPPTLTEITDPTQWVNNLRAEEEERLKRLKL